ncbi:DNA replication/repair protein RecF [Ferrimicrobium acidiphilum]|uniref:DNA replication/repair protein RecF n=1 Tax=Ferrimicrobium acidiphilum TaxID=121039 RepID=UPI0023F1F95F|nr:DNA replication and repair protein RecF [Ferrimicrobium acidiphilum]
MEVLAARVDHFRNITSAELNFQRRNLLVGPNGAGKTSCAEAIAVALNGHSFRTSEMQMLVQRGSEYWRTEATISLTDRIPHRIVMSGSHRQRERVQLDERNVRVAQLGARFPVVIFVPEDRDLVVGQPSVRREYLDGILGRSDPGIQRILSRATKILKQRQNLIRSGRPDKVSLDIFDTELAKASIAVAVAREHLLGYLQIAVEQFNQGISGTSEAVSLRYVRSWNEDPLEDLIQARVDDIRKGTTSIGFHRDDFIIELNGMPAKLTASQGQVRSLAVALRIGSAGVLERKLGEAPILILDDVFAEFDRERAMRLIDLVDRYQTFATNTERVASLDGWSVFEVNGGVVVPT